MEVGVALFSWVVASLRRPARHARRDRWRHGRCKRTCMHVSGAQARSRLMRCSGPTMVRMREAVAPCSTTHLPGSVNVLLQLVVDLVRLSWRRVVRLDAAQVVAVEACRRAAVARRRHDQHRRACVKICWRSGRRRCRLLAASRVGGSSRHAACFRVRREDALCLMTLDVHFTMMREHLRCLP